MTQAYAQAPEASSTTATTVADGRAPLAAAASPTSGFMGQMAMMFMIFAVFYFLIIRPQQKRMKKHQEMINSVRRGDKVVTAGGLVGTVQRVESETELMVEIADGVVVKVMKSTLADVLSKPMPAENADKNGKKSDKQAA